MLAIAPINLKEETEWKLYVSISKWSSSLASRAIPDAEPIESKSNKSSSQNEPIVIVLFVAFDDRRRVRRQKKQNVEVIIIVVSATEEEDTPSSIMNQIISFTIKDIHTQ